jgi:hypothetical protein
MDFWLKSAMSRFIFAKVQCLDSGGRFSPVIALQEFQTFRTNIEQEESVLEKVLKRLFVVQSIHSANELYNLLREFDQDRSSPHVQIAEDSKVLSIGSFKIIVIDSISSLINSVVRTKDNCKGQALMAEIGRILKKLAWEHELAFVVTNNAVRDWNSNVSVHISENENGDDEQKVVNLQNDLVVSLKPALGESWAIIPDNRFIIDAENNVHIVRLQHPLAAQETTPDDDVDTGDES